MLFVGRWMEVRMRLDVAETLGVGSFYRSRGMCKAENKNPLRPY
jgi:hypothetical protein